MGNQPWCTCLFDPDGKWDRMDGWTRGKDGVHWVHFRCDKPSKANYMRWKKKFNEELYLDLDEGRPYTWQDMILEEFYYFLGEDEDEEA